MKLLPIVGCDECKHNNLNACCIDKPLYRHFTEEDRELTFPEWCPLEDVNE